jgi:hypothetical protein
MMRRLLFGWLCWQVLQSGAGWGEAQELAPATYAQLRAKIDVSSEELCWQKVAWVPYWDGLVAAQQQDRPIFYWIYFGDPRGGC